MNVAIPTENLEVYSKQLADKVNLAISELRRLLLVENMVRCILFLEAKLLYNSVPYAFFFNLITIDIEKFISSLIFGLEKIQRQFWKSRFKRSRSGRVSLTGLPFLAVPRRFRPIDIEKFISSLIFGLEKI